MNTGLRRALTAASGVAVVVLIGVSVAFACTRIGQINIDPGFGPQRAPRGWTAAGSSPGNR